MNCRRITQITLVITKRKLGLAGHVMTAIGGQLRQGIQLIKPWSTICQREPTPNEQRTDRLKSIDNMIAEMGKTRDVLASQIPI
ncbi:hypothetical protein GCK72_011017 [Caenorhabditis remanei]|uniref:Uncharacterized protein n=1 Tax=Caenorhabditis remanei TaxID=31234 RepID=A0A6A5H6N5_CAERE|nr:hypothetical protein GCK72_011017 [Caenorhabditis remanei]KAF1762755.1 hypothetical protein GCK72_011017 [Caenorhabditis remanei]